MTKETPPTVGASHLGDGLGDIAEKLRQYIPKGDGYNSEFAHDLWQAADEIDHLRQVAQSVYEVWARSEGIPQPETVAEAYLLRLVEQMRDEAVNGLPNAELRGGLPVDEDKRSDE